MNGSAAAGADAAVRAQERLATARARLVLERPFTGMLALHLQPVPAGPPGCSSLGSDGRHLWYSPAFVLAASLAELQFWLAHVALHCALGHGARRGPRERLRWDLACDHAVNLLLHDDGMTLPAGAVADPGWRGLGAEEIYPLVPPVAGREPLDHHDWAPGSGDTGLREAAVAAGGGQARAEAAAPAQAPSAGVDSGDGWDDAGHEPRRHAPAAPPVSPMPGVDAGADSLWRQRLTTAADAARQAGRLGPSWERALAAGARPALPWRTLLARFVAAVAREDFTFARPPRREGPALLPRAARGGLRLVAALDTSGSIGAAELDAFVAELDALKAQVSATLLVHACDERLSAAGPWRFEPWEPVRLPSGLDGGGGTRFTPVFDWIEREGVAPDALLWFTDALGEFPPGPPAYPVLWLVKGPARVPFGERVTLT